MSERGTVTNKNVSRRKRKVAWSRRIRPEDFPAFLQRVSVPLRELNHDGLPVGICSGCLADYGGCRWVFAVEHSTGNMGRWAIEVGYEPGHGTKLYQIGEMNFVARASSPSAAFETLDMAYAKVPSDLVPRWQVSNDRGEIILDVPRLVLRPDLRCAPRDGQEYGFSGNIRPTLEQHFDDQYFGAEIACYTGLRFGGEDEDFCYFRLPFEHPGADYFKGTSGAPICDPGGNIVGLVCGPGNKPDTIRGLKISYFRRALDVEIAHARSSRL